MLNLSSLYVSDKVPEEEIVEKYLNQIFSTEQRKLYMQKHKVEFNSFRDKNCCLFMKLIMIT